MNERRILGATDIKDIFLQTINANGEVREHQSDTGETIAILRCRDFPSVDIHISSRAIDVLAEHLRVITAIDVSANAEVLTRALAQIAIITNHAGPQVTGMSADAQRAIPLIRKIGTEFAVACAISFADFHKYVIDPSSLPQNKTSIALLMNDEHALVRIFGGNSAVMGIQQVLPGAARTGFGGLSPAQMLAVVLVVLVAVGLPFVQVRLPPEIQSLMQDEEATLGVAIAITLAIVQSRHH